MARSFVAQDAYLLMNLLVKEATGQNPTIQVVDTSTFVAAGEQVLKTGTENVLNAISQIIGKTLVATRPYEPKLKIINAINSGLFTNRLRKISFYSTEAKPTGAFNTNLNDENLKDGATNEFVSGHATKSMWEQSQSVPLEMNFHGRDVWSDALTVYTKQLQIAFRNENEFASFMNGAMQEKKNCMSRQSEAFNRMTLLNKIGGVYDLYNLGVTPKSVVNLTEKYNAKFGTSYTSNELRTTYLKEFLEFFVSEFKLTSKYLERSTNLYHWTPEKAGYTILRHTPKDRQRAILYEPLFIDAEAMVMPEIFNPKYLDLEKQYEGVTFWQNVEQPEKISVTPAIPNVATPSAGQIAGEAVEIPYMVGMLYDVDGIMTDFQLEDATATPLEARKNYYNLWWHYAKNAINDFTENCVIFIMADPAPAAPATQAKK